MRPEQGAISIMPITAKSEYERNMPTSTETGGINLVDSEMLVPAKQPRSAAADEPVRILKMITVFAFGGTERQVINLATRMDRSRFALEMACLKKSGHYLDEINQ